jgi:hypothetical protein
VTWLVPDSARYEQMVKVASRQPPEAWRLHRVAKFEDAIGALVGGSDDPSAP